MIGRTTRLALMVAMALVTAGCGTGKPSRLASGTTTPSTSTTVTSSPSPSTSLATTSTTRRSTPTTARPPTTLPAPACAHQDVSVKITTDKPSYALGEPVLFVLTVTNVSGHACTAHYADQRDSGRRDMNAGGFGTADGAGWSANYCGPPAYNPQQPTTESWAVGQQRAYAVTWDQSNPKGDIADHCDPNHAPAGDYYASGDWFGVVDGARADQVTFTIRSS